MRFAVWPLLLLTLHKASICLGAHCKPWQAPSVGTWNFIGNTSAFKASDEQFSCSVPFNKGVWRNESASTPKPRYHGPSSDFFVPHACDLTYFPPPQFRACLGGLRIAFVGISFARYDALALTEYLGAPPMWFFTRKVRIDTSYSINATHLIEVGVGGSPEIWRHDRVFPERFSLTYINGPTGLYLDTYHRMVADVAQHGLLSDLDYLIVEAVSLDPAEAHLHQYLSALIRPLKIKHLLPSPNRVVIRSLHARDPENGWVKEYWKTQGNAVWSNLSWMTRKWALRRHYRFWDFFNHSAEDSGFRWPEGSDGSHVPCNPAIMMRMQVLANNICPTSSLQET